MMKQNEPVSWNDDDPFNPKLGLWTEARPGHTAPVAALQEVHPGTNASSRLIVAAQRRQLQAFPCTQVLEALTRLQVRDASEQHGCSRWYAEEPHPVDSNASFFICLNLLVLNRCYREDLDELQDQLLQDLLRAFLPWFKGEAREGKVHYPNKFLGDLVCLWLLLESQEEDPSPYEEILLRAARYWQDSSWGWGEHLSDVYSNILLDELSCLLLLSTQLPEELRQAYEALFRNLLQLEDQYAGGPRVPCIRSYALNQGIPHNNYRSKIRVYDEAELPRHNPEAVPHSYILPFGQALMEQGWEELAGEPAPLQERFEVNCFGGAQGFVERQGESRLGVLSAFPVMPDTDHSRWGLSWQSMPLAFFRSPGDWGLLRWSATEHGIERSHPARNKHDAYLQNALSDQVIPPIVGLTRSQRHQGQLVVERCMPRISKEWTQVADRFCLTGFQGKATSHPDLEGGWQGLTLSWEDGMFLTLYVHPLDSGGRLEYEQQDHGLEWSLIWDRDRLQSQTRLRSVWAVHLGSESPPAPHLQEEQGWFERPHFLPGTAWYQLQWGEQRADLGRLPSENEREF